jgi:hypothetical protein
MFNCGRHVVGKIEGGRLQQSKGPCEAKPKLGPIPIKIMVEGFIGCKDCRLKTYIGVIARRKGDWGKKQVL